MSDISKSSMLSVAAWLQLEAAIKELEAAVLRGDCPAQTAARERAHDLLDSHMDLKAQAMTLAKALGGQ